MPAQTFVFCESSFQWLGAQFLSPHLPNGNPGEGGAGQAFSCGSLPGHVLCWPPPRWAPWSVSGPPISNPTSWAYGDTPVSPEVISCRPHASL